MKNIVFENIRDFINYYLKIQKETFTLKDKITELKQQHLPIEVCDHSKLFENGKLLENLSPIICESIIIKLKKAEFFNVCFIR